MEQYRSVLHPARCRVYEEVPICRTAGMKSTGEERRDREIRLQLFLGDGYTRAGSYKALFGPSIALRVEDRNDTK